MRLRNLAGFMLFLVLPSLIAAQGVSRTALFVESSARLDQDGAPDVVTTAFVGGRFVPLPSVRLNASIACLVPDAVRFFHVDDAELTPGYLFFNGASLEFPSLAGSDLNGIVFSGFYDDLSSESLMRTTLKSGIERPFIPSSLYILSFSRPDPVDGTGIGAHFNPWRGNSALGLYSYWNGRIDSGMTVRNDAQIAVNAPSIRLNAFAGMRLKTLTADVKLRGGFTASLGDPKGNEFYAELGVGDVTPGSGMEREMYMLFEPRIHRERSEFAFAFFSSPTAAASPFEPDQSGTTLGTNLRLSFGSLDLDRMKGSIAATAAFDPERPGTVTPLNMSVGPSFSCLISDYRLDACVELFPFRLDDMSTAGVFTLSLKAVY